MKNTKLFQLKCSLFALMITGSFQSHAQTAGDDCSVATLLTAGTSCVTANYNNIGATSSSGVANPTCGFYSGNDVWFFVVVPVSGKLQIEVNNVSGINRGWAIYTGVCSSLTQLTCVSASNYAINNPSLGGQMLYVRVWNRNSLSGGTFSICAWEPNTAANDFCSAAVPLSVSTSCSFLLYTNIGSTAEPTSVAPNPTCGFYQGGDAWFTFVMPASGQARVETNNVAGGINPQFAVYSGTCGSFVQLNCAQLINAVNINNLSLAGQTLYIRVWDYNSAFTGGDFQLCVWEPNTPANDFCVAAISIPVNTSCSFSTYSNVGSTAESASVSPNPTCGFYQGGDVWFALVMPASGHLQVQTNFVSGGINAQVAVYSGSCGSMTQVGCGQSNDLLNIHNHSLGGQSLYVRVWNHNSAHTGGNFQLCAWEPNTPENDFCANAFPLTVDSACSYTISTNIGCTAEAVGISPNPTCGFYEGADVWFTVVMPTSGLLAVNKNDIADMNAQFALYSGTCGSMTQISCSVSGSTIYLNNVSLAGQTLYLRVWNTNTNKGGTFGICAYDTTCQITITNVSTTNTSCPNTSDGTILVSAYCANCTGALQYSINNGGLYQSNNTFSGKGIGTYIIKVRDQADASCFAVWPGNPVSIFSDGTLTYFYGDYDGDSYGNISVVLASCSVPPAGYVTNGLDCDDFNPEIHPGATETCNGFNDDCDSVRDEGCIILNLKVYLEGYYAGAGGMLPALLNSWLSIKPDTNINAFYCDTVRVELHESTAPFSLVKSIDRMLFTDGSIYASYSDLSLLNNSYYIVIKHRASLETWSSAPITILNTPNMYDFTSFISNAYGYNMIDVGVIYGEDPSFAFFSGDISDPSFGRGYQDGIIESQDYADMENAVYQIFKGYTPEEITGDGIVESLDYGIMETNVYFIISVVRP
jgi:hypothetical protein